MESKESEPLDLDKVTPLEGDVIPGSLNDQIANAELMRRQVVLQQEATEAAKNAAEAAERTAQHTSKTARYMLWSALAILASSVAQALFAYLALRY